MKVAHPECENKAACRCLTKQDANGRAGNPRMIAEEKQKCESNDAGKC